MLPTLSSLPPQVASTALNPGAGRQISLSVGSEQLSDLNEIVGSFEVTLAALDEASSSRLEVSLAVATALADEAASSGHGLPPGGNRLPPGAGAPAAGAPPNALEAGTGRAWQPGELLALLASERELSTAAARPAARASHALGSAIADELPSLPGSQGAGTVLRPDAVLAAELGAGGNTRAQGGGTALTGGTATALFAAQSPLVPDSAGFGRGLGERLVILVQQGLQQAQLRVHPEHLGPMDVRLRIEGESVQLTLGSPHASVREALEGALPRLRETLAEHGLSLSQAQVGGGEGQSGNPGSSDDQDDRGGQGVGGAADGLGDEQGDGPLTPRSLALVDIFA